LRLKLDLHPIYSDSRAIEDALQRIVDEAIAKRAKEVEIIPGKGSGALKKSVIRFLQRPEVKSLYHRLEKDSDNWGRLFIYFRHDRPDAGPAPKSASATPVASAPCACCGDPLGIPVPEDEAASAVLVTCPACGSPNRVTLRRDRKGAVHARADLDYEDA
jgi:hypothetical protein